MPSITKNRGLIFVSAFGLTVGLGISIASVSNATIFNDEQPQSQILAEPLVEEELVQADGDIGGPIYGVIGLNSFHPKPAGQLAYGLVFSENWQELWN